MLHPLLGLPVFALMMFLVFQMTFWLGNPLVDLLETLKIAAAEAVRSHFDGLFGSLLADGVIEGVGSVLQFVPLIGLLYIAMAILEDSGYMARAAFVMDRFMHRIGLHGKSAIPMLLGFGCTVPAVMATRMLDNRADRLTTMMVLPLMSCGARLPVYFLILGALFPSRELFEVAGVGVTNQAAILFAMYLTGIVLAVFSVWLLRKTIFRASDSHFVMELPPYRWPTLRGMLIHGGQMTWHYVKKAGTVIFIVAVILWAMKTWPVALQATELAAQAQLAQNADAKNDLLARAEKSQLEDSAIGQLGKTIAPIFAPCGLDWKVSTALVGALAAKEVFVTQLGVMYSTSADDTGEKLSAKISTDYTPLQGIVMMLFILIASPCMGTLVVVARQAGSWRWAALQWLYLTVLAWVVCVGVYQIGRLCGAG